MSDPPPVSLLITPDLRRRLQQRYDEARQLAAAPRPGRHRVHELLAECVRADPGNILYLQALLANLREWTPQPQRTWLPKWLGGKGSGFFGGEGHSHEVRPSSAKESRPPEEALRAAPELLLKGRQDPNVLGELAEAAGACDLDEAELLYLHEARRMAPDDAGVLRQLARALTRQGRFEDAVNPWLAVLALDPDAEAAQAVEDLKDAAHLVGADGDLTRAQHAAGADLRILAKVEEQLLQRSQQRIEMARARAAADPHPKAQRLVGEFEKEHNRLLIDIYHLRAERLPQDAGVRIELARRLKQAGNYSGAIQRLEEALKLSPEDAFVCIELGENWQHLRQFGKALDYYQQAAALARDAAALKLALYRAGVLAAAMQQNAEAREHLQQLISLDPAYKDARQRLDNLA